MIVNLSPYAQSNAKTYTISATGYKSVLTLDKDTYWNIDHGTASVKIRVTAWSSTLGADPHTFTATCNFAGSASAFWVDNSVGVNNYTDNHINTLALFAPKTTSYGPQIAVAIRSATETFVKVEVLDSTTGWTLASTFGGDPGTTNYNRINCEVGRYNYNFSSEKIAANITGTCDGRAGSAYDSLYNDRLKAGATAIWVNGTTRYGIIGARLIGVGADGLVYPVEFTPETSKFQLPFRGGRSGSNYGVNATSVYYATTIRGIINTEFTTAKCFNTDALSASTTYSGTGTAYAVKWVVRTHTSATASTDSTSWAIGKNVYICGNIVDGCFRPYSTKATAQSVTVPKGQAGFTVDTAVNMDLHTLYMTQTPMYTANYNTFLCIGRADHDTAHITVDTYNCTAYTYNSSNKLTAIDGKAIQDSNTTYSNFVKSGTGAAAGLVPAPSTTAGTTKYLREDGTWQVPPDTNTVYTHPTGDGNHHVPATGTTNNGKVLMAGSTAGSESWQSLPTSNGTSTAGVIKTTSTVSSSTGYTACPVINGVPYYKDTNTTYTLASLGAAPSTHTHSSSDVTAMTGYAKASAVSAIATTDSLNTAIGKLEKALDGKGTSNLAIGTTSTTAAAGNHTHSGYASSSHNQAASTITAGTFAGAVVANAAAVSTLTTKQVRNITISTSEPTSSDGENGDIWITY